MKNPFKIRKKKNHSAVLDNGVTNFRVTTARDITQVGFYGIYYYYGNYMYKKLYSLF